MSKMVAITGIPAKGKYYEFEEEAWHKGFSLRGQTTIRLRRHHLKLLQQIAKDLPLHTSRPIDLSRWEFGHAGVLVRSLARVQLRNQLVECKAAPVEFVKVEPKTSVDIFRCAFQSALRCEVNLDLDRLRDTMLDVLVTPQEALTNILKVDAEFCSDKEKTLEDWKMFAPKFRGFICEEGI